MASVGGVNQQAISQGLQSAAEGIQQAPNLDAGIQAFGQLDAGGLVPKEDLLQVQPQQLPDISMPAVALEPAAYLDEVTKAGVETGIDVTAVKAQLANPQLDISAQLQEVAELPVQQLAIRREIATAVGEASTTAEGVAATAAGEGDALVNAFGKNIDKIDTLQEELMGLDMSTPEGQKRAFEIQQELQELMTMQSLILNMISMENDLKQRIIDTMRA